MRFPFLSANRLLAALVLAMPLPAMAVEEQGQLPLDELRTFADVYNQIRSGYVEEIDDSTLLEYAIQGMLMGLDPHSVYLTEDAFKNLQDTTTGEFTGLGLEVGMEDGYVKIISPIDGSPAAEAGLQSGDVILKLDQAPVKGMSLNDAIDIMRGPKKASPSM
jgi:carboxyl-terminal processing protease